MATSSTTAGYLLPSDEPQDDDALVDALQEVIVGVTAIPSDLVRPRWQPEPPQRPDFDVDWAAFGLVSDLKDQSSYQGVVGTPSEPALTVERDSIVTMLLSIYGPNASGLIDRFRDGLMIDQNRDGLFAQNMALVEIQDAITLPAKIQERWVKRVDVRVLFRRRTTRVYPVRTLLSAEVTVENEKYSTVVIVSN